VEPGHSKVIVVKVDKTNLIDYCYVRTERPEKGKKKISVSSSTPP
jgi:hypothetical protein